MTDAPNKLPGDSPIAGKRVAEAKADGTGTKAVVPVDPTERVAAALRSITPATTARSDSRTNPLLDQLVYGDNDLVGLVAYAMHEVNRRDWRAAYEQTHGRAPSEAEFNAYLVGEQLERRLETYRRLAEDAIAKVATGDTTMRRLAENVTDGPRIVGMDAATTPATVRAAARTLHATNADKAVVPPEKKRELIKLALYLFFLLIAVAALAYLLRFGIDPGMPPR